LRAMYSRPITRPSGSQRSRSSGSLVIAAALTRAKTTRRLTVAPCTARRGTRGTTARKRSGSAFIAQMDSLATHRVPQAPHSGPLAGGQPPRPALHAPA
jgi:hypothetical protein